MLHWENEFTTEKRMAEPLGFPLPALHATTPPLYWKGETPKSSPVAYAFPRLWEIKTTSSGGLHKP
ncbi:hypothetical protein CLOSTMETH_03001 [[Clostridium] methylpentosum DSM 5476]|uniref:Uncharacterized protein n=1 Tax=[Clostridium] methylpentosum DSM 5476 TaxID=537013 RepID=C0EGK8_9FIRM|nr:hypothetical protein CLOSTMETH_03001 [[Clostridium] methylpentosum DSM 5476]